MAVRWTALTHDGETLALPILETWTASAADATWPDYRGADGKLQITIRPGEFVDPCRVDELVTEVPSAAVVRARGIVEIAERACLKIAWQDGKGLHIQYVVPMGSDDEAVIVYTLHDAGAALLQAIDSLETPNETFESLDTLENLNEQGQLELYPVLVPETWKVVDEDGGLIPSIRPC